MSSTRTRSEYRLALHGTPLLSAGADGFVLRPVERRDHDDLARVMLDGYRGSVDDEGERQAEAGDAIDHYFATMVWRYGLVLTRDGAVVAFAFVVTVGGRHFVDPVVTASGVKRTGLGTAVVSAVLASLQVDGIVDVGATITDGDVPSEQLFASLGFVRVGPWPPVAA